MEPKWTEQKQSIPNSTKVDRMDQIRLEWIELIEQDQNGQNGPNRTNVERIRPKQTE